MSEPIGVLEEVHDVVLGERLLWDVGPVYQFGTVRLCL